MKVIPLTVPQINWSGFVTTVKDITSKSPTRKLDAYGIKAGNLPSYIQALGAFQDSEMAPLSYLRTPACLPILETISITFLIQAPKSQIFEILKVGHMSIVQASSKNDDEDLLVASNSLAAWVSIIRRAPTIPVVKEIANWLVRLELRDLLAGCDRLSFEG